MIQLSLKTNSRILKIGIYLILFLIFGISYSCFFSTGDQGTTGGFLFAYSVSFCAVKLAGISSLPLLTLSCHSFGTSKTFFFNIYFVIIYKLC